VSLTETSPRKARAVALRALTSPWSLTAITVLIVNDRLLKNAMPGWATGKLSDFAGMVFFPLLVAVLISGRGHRASRRPLWVGITATGALFSAINISPPVARSLEWLMAAVAIPWRITVDPTDLAALPFLAVAVAIWRRSEAMPVSPSRDRRRFEVIVVLVALAASTATSCDDAYPAAWAVETRDGALLAFTDSGAYLSNDGGETWVDTEVDDEDRPSPSEGRTTACLEDDPEHCFHLVSPLTVVETLPDGERRTAFEVSSDRVEYMEMAFGEGCSDYAVDVTDIAITDGDQPVVVVAAGDTGLLLRGADGSWERGVLPGWTVAPVADIGRGAPFEISLAWGIGLLFAMVVASIASRRLVPGHGNRDGFWWGAARFTGAFGAVGVALLGSGSFGSLIGGILAVAMVPAFVGYGRLVSWLHDVFSGERWTRIVSVSLLPIAGAVLATIGWLLWRTAVIESYGTARSLVVLVLILTVVVPLGLVFIMDTPRLEDHGAVESVRLPHRDQSGRVTPGFIVASVVGMLGTITWTVAAGSVLDADSTGAVVAGTLALVGLWYVGRGSELASELRITIALAPLLALGALAVGGWLEQWGSLALLVYSGAALWMIPAKRGGVPRRGRRLAVLVVSFLGLVLSGLLALGTDQILLPYPVVFLLAVLVSEDRPPVDGGEDETNE
jgi:hypothetical protein